MLLQVCNDKPLMRKTVCQVSVTDETGLYSVVGDNAVNCLKIQRVHNIQSVTDFAWNKNHYPKPPNCLLLDVPMYRVPSLSWHLSQAENTEYF